jgi:beta-mannosidase
VPRPAKLAHLLRLAADAHVNLLRVWGGGLIETPEFYRLCDRLGLLVWQEFGMSSSGIESVPATDRQFVRMMADQARVIVPRLRHHPSLAIWCGGNELADQGVPLDDSAPVLTALRDVVAELHPDAAWLPTSPSGPTFGHGLDAIEADPDGQHDVHGPWEHQGLTDHYPLYDVGTSLLHSEFGVEGMTNRRALAAVVPEPDRWPADKSNPVYAHLGAWWNNAPLVRAAFGGRLDDLDLLRRASQFLQADGLRYAVEANRRRAFRNSGTIPWQFNESYPNAWCTAAVDHRGDPKPAYHAVRRAYRPWHGCARLERQAWAGHPQFRARIFGWGDTASAEPTPVTVTATLRDTAGTLAAERIWEITAPPGGLPLEVGELAADLSELDTELFLLDVATDRAAGPANRYLLSRTADLSPVLDLAPATVDTGLSRDGNTWRVTLSHRDGPAALGLTLEDDRPYQAAGWAVPDDNLFDLLPGESRTVTVTWRDADQAGRVLRLSGFNLGARHVR